MPEAARLRCAAPRGAGAQRPRLRAPELSLGRRTWKVREDLRQDQSDQVGRTIVNIGAAHFSSNAPVGANGPTTVGAWASATGACAGGSAPFEARLRRGLMS